MTTTKAPTEKRTITESLELLTGYEEQAIEKRFGTDIDNLRTTMTLRALVWADLTRAGLDGGAAYKQVMEMTIKQISTGTYFAEEPEDFDPEAPDSAEGKDE